MFHFNGDILTSKSWANRALVIQYFNPEINLEINSNSDDISYLKKSIQAIDHSKVFNLGLGGTSLRFFIFLISRKPGNWTLAAQPRLFERPQREAIIILKQLGVQVELTGQAFEIQSQGWRQSAKINCAADMSSQFISGLLLSCWNLEFDLEIEIKKPIISYGYLKMTIELLLASGMNLKFNETEKNLNLYVPKNQKASVKKLSTELDISSAFALATAAVINGDIQITNWNDKSTQPDFIFLELFAKMGIKFSVEKEHLRIRKHKNWKPLDFNLNNSPDLFPVLAVLCAFAEGVSNLTGGSQLKYKESDRLVKTKELLDLINVNSEILTDGLRIYGSGTAELSETKTFKFNPDHDHRMAMAAGLLKLKGYNIEIAQADVVNKSYPNFWRDIGFSL